MNEQQQFFKERNEVNVFVQIVQRYLPFWPLFVFTIALSLSIAYIYLRAQPKIYLASGKVLLKDPNRNGSDSKVLDALNIFGEKKIVENEIVVIRSSGVMQEVVKRLDLYYTIYNEGTVRTEELYGSNSPIAFIALTKDSAENHGRYYFSVDWQHNILHMNGQAYPLGSTIALDGVSYKMVPHPAYKKNLTGKKYFVVFNGVEGAAGGLIGSLNVAPISSQSTVMDIKLQTQVPEKGKDVLNALFSVYNEAAITDKNQTAAKTLAFIEGRLNLVISQLDSVERGVQNYKSANEISDLGSQAQLYMETVKELDKQKSELDIQLDVLNSINAYVSNKGQKAGTVPSLLLVNDASLAGLLEKLYAAEIERDRLRTLTGDKSDAVQAATATVEQFQSSIRENMASIRTNLVSAKDNINSRIAINSDILKTIPQKERGLIDISRQQAIKNNIYTFLLQKREETALNSASTIADLRVIEKATAGGPISPVPKSYYITGLLIGLVIAAGFVTVREQFNRKVLFRQEVESKTSVPVVAEIMQLQISSPIVIKEGKRTAIAEQFRSLRTNLTFMGVNEEHNTILVTSSVSGEGKSFNAINLAISFTLTGKRVALLELDLRKPKVSKLLGLKRDPGISNYLVKQSTLAEITQSTEIKNLFVLSSGPIPPNPAELLLKDRFKQLMAEVKEQFDFVIIDSAPIGPVTDAYLLKDYADATVYVVRHDVTPKVYLKMIQELKEQNIFKNMSIVFNGLKRRGITYYGYGYSGPGYGYGYGYSYGYGSKYYVEEDSRTHRKSSGKKRLFKSLGSKEVE